MTPQPASAFPPLSSALPTQMHAHTYAALAHSEAGWLAVPLPPPPRGSSSSPPLLRRLAGDCDAAAGARGRGRSGSGGRGRRHRAAPRGARRPPGHRQGAAAAAARGRMWAHALVHTCAPAACLLLCWWQASVHARTCWPRSRLPAHARGTRHLGPGPVVSSQAPKGFAAYPQSCA